jgi:hypothetical protein
MANQKISELNELLSPLSGDTLPIVNNGETKKISVSNLLSSNTGSYATTGSNTFIGNQNITGSLIVSGSNIEFTGSVKLQNDLQVDGNIQSNGSMFLQPDINDSRNIEIYNTDSTDIHIKGNATYTFFGDDSNYVKIDNGLEKITINTNSGTTINGLLNLSPVIELPTGSTLGDMVVSGSNLYFHNGIGWNSLNMTSI